VPLNYWHKTHPQDSDHPVSYVGSQDKPMTKTTVTFTVDAADAFWVRCALNDSIIRWGDLAIDAADGKRPDLDVESCRSIRARALRLYNDFVQQEIEQS